MWDYYLSLGLNNIVRSRPWRQVLPAIRQIALCRWQRQVTRSYFKWRKTVEVAGKDKSILIEADLAARDAITRAAEATWWEWTGGSRPFFWNWDVEVQGFMLRGLEWWLRPGFVPKRRRQRAPSDKETRRKIAEKLTTIRDRKYVEAGPIDALMHYFDVKKGVDDIRMVYDGTASGLNDWLWAPWFLLPAYN